MSQPGGPHRVVIDQKLPADDKLIRILK